MGAVLKPTRFSVYVRTQRVGVVIPRNDHEWIFLYLLAVQPDGKFFSYIAESPESAIALCPFMPK